jgi:hypothetical protein
MRRPPSLAPHRREGGAERTSFAPLLGEILVRMSSARAAILVDSEGETVEYEGIGAPFDLMIAAAHARIAVSSVERSSLGKPRLLAFRGSQGGVLVKGLADGYALVILMRPRAGLLGSRRALDAGAWRISREAGLTFERPAWFPVLVDPTDQAKVLLTAPSAVLSPRASSPDAPVVPLPLRPRASFPSPTLRPDLVREDPGGDTYKCTILGTIAGLPRRERGFRVRLPSRAELNLVREPGDHWYADVPLEGVDGLEASIPSMKPDP